MLNEAKELMEMVNADFIFTGEVMGQRPMSQVKNKLFLVEKQTGLQGKLVRPLSAKLLPPTDPEISGLLDRELLEGISGRSRKRQIALAKEFGLEDYPSPASGCLLTDSNYSIRLRDLIAHTGHLTFDDLNLLRYGRHFRLDDHTKVIVGRDENENNNLLANKKDYHLQIELTDIGSPVTLLSGNITDDNILKAGMITARYTKAKNWDEITIVVTENNKQKLYKTSPATDDDISQYMVK